MTRVVVGQDTKVTSPLFVDDDEAATNATGTPTCAVARADGTSLTAATVASSGTGRYTAALTASTHCTALDVLTLTWTATVSSATRKLTQLVDVVGGRLFTIADLRGEPSLSSAVDFPSTLLGQVRDECEDYAEEWCGVAFNPRYSLETFTSCGESIFWPRWAKATAVKSVTVDGTTEDVTGWRVGAGGSLERYNYGAVTPGLQVVVGYEHGWTNPPPKLVRECLRWARREVLQRQAKIGPDVLSESGDGVTTRYSLPSPTDGRPTGVLALDPVLAEYRARALVG